MLLLRPSGEPEGAVSPVVRDERGAERRQEDAGGAMVNPLAADPDAPAIQVYSN